MWLDLIISSQTIQEFSISPREKHKFKSSWKHYSTTELWQRNWVLILLWNTFNNISIQTLTTWMRISWQWKETFQVLFMEKHSWITSATRREEEWEHKSINTFHHMANCVRMWINSTLPMWSILSMEHKIKGILFKISSCLQDLNSLQVLTKSGVFPKEAETLIKVKLISFQSNFVRMTGFLQIHPEEQWRNKRFSKCLNFMISLKSWWILETENRDLKSQSSAASRATSIAKVFFLWTFICKRFISFMIFFMTRWHFRTGKHGCKLCKKRKPQWSLNWTTLNKVWNTKHILQNCQLFQMKKKWVRNTEHSWE